MGRAKSGNPPGRPAIADRLAVRGGITVPAELRSWAILELVAERRGFANVGYMLDAIARDYRLDVTLAETLSAERVEKRALDVQLRLGLD